MLFQHFNAQNWADLRQRFQVIDVYDEGSHGVVQNGAQALEVDSKKNDVWNNKFF